MDKIVKYIDVVVPVEACTLRCEYCYLTSLKEETPKQLEHLSFDASFFRKALAKERLGGCCRISFCGTGETTLLPNFIDYVQEILNEGHFVDVVTNGTVTKVLQQLTQLAPELRERILVRFSLHYLELKKHQKLDMFFNNINLLRGAGVSISVSLVASDAYIPFIDEIKQVCVAHIGAYPHISFARDESKSEMPLESALNQEEYVQTWQSFNCSSFDFQNAIFSEQRKEFCMAGAWTYVLYMKTGELLQCHRSIVSQNIYRNINEPIMQKPIGHFCKASHCICGQLVLSQGVIPELHAPTFASTHNRTDADGKDWLTMREIEVGSLTFKECNHVYNALEKYLSDTAMFNVIFGRKIKRKFRKFLHLK